MRYKLARESWGWLWSIVCSQRGFDRVQHRRCFAEIKWLTWIWKSKLNCVEMLDMKEWMRVLYKSSSTSLSLLKFTVIYVMSRFKWFSCGWNPCRASWRLCWKFSKCRRCFLHCCWTRNWNNSHRTFKTLWFPTGRLVHTSLELECISNLSNLQNKLFYMDSIYWTQNGQHGRGSPTSRLWCDRIRSCFGPTVWLTLNNNLPSLHWCITIPITSLFCCASALCRQISPFVISGMNLSIYA